MFPEKISRENGGEGPVIKDSGCFLGVSESCYVGHSGWKIKAETRTKQESYGSVINRTKLGEREREREGGD